MPDNIIANMIDKKNLTPAMLQFFEVKAQNPEAILFFRVGDFYELFFDDAEKVAPILDLTLTSRNKQSKNPVPMCGVPYHAAEKYINQLANLGFKVAVCDQVEDAKLAQGLVKREVVRVVTAATVLSDEGQIPTQPRFLSAILEDKKKGLWYLAGLEVSTGDLILGIFESADALKAELLIMDPAECLLSENASENLENINKDLNYYITFSSPEDFNKEKAYNSLKEIYGEIALKSWEIENWPGPLKAAGAVLNYAEKFCGGKLKHLAPPKFLWQQNYMNLDESAIRNLEIVESFYGSNNKATLLNLLDQNTTYMGSRLLRQWLVRPLLNKTDVLLRHGAIEALLKNALLRNSLDALLKKTGDIERALSRLVLHRGGPKDLATTRNTLKLLPQFKELLSNSNSKHLFQLSEKIDNLEKLHKILEDFLVEIPPFSSKEGGIINLGVSQELDELLELEKGGKQKLLAIEQREKASTGINTLKIGFNRVFGYFIEVTKSNLANVPAQWIRKQTISNAERYITPELKEWEEKILHAGEKRLILEEQIFLKLKEKTIQYASTIKLNALILAETDVLSALAKVAEKHNWVRAEITDDDIINIQGGRHPVVEQALAKNQAFVANDVLLSAQNRILIITGPNMAGKSTILRQTAIIVLLNQIGSFVPAEKAKLSLRDRIFTRVGASDDLSGGRSTFMVEMSETARILKLATPKSLVILDEVGRGTSTYDGLSIAWAVTEYLHDLETRGVPTLFATHYHELINLAKTKINVKNFNVSVKTWKDKIIFLRKLNPGGVSRSHGLAVAALAGLPKKVIARAQEVLNDLSRSGDHLIRPEIRQLELFNNLDENYSEKTSDNKKYTDFLTEISNLNPEALTPIKALNILADLKQKAEEVLGHDKN